MQAYISHIIPLSTEHWEGVKSFVVFLAGCDFKCPYCYSADSLDRKEENLVFLNDIKQQISSNKVFIDAVVFSGGEPCLNRPALLNLARFARSLGLKIGIETNGSKPFVINSLIREGLVDFIALDLKSSFDPAKFEAITKSQTFFKPVKDIIEDIKQTLKILKEHEDSLDIEIRTTFTPTLLNREDIFEIADSIKDLRCVWVLQQFQNLGSLVNPNLANMPSPSKRDLIALQKAVIKRHPDVVIRVRAV